VPAFLKLEGIEKHFGSFTALQGIDLQIESGEFVCFLGPSGCGKTTLLRIVAGLEAQSAGRLWQAGREISTLAALAARLRTSSSSPTRCSRTWRCADNVAYGLVNRRGPRARMRARVAELLALVGPARQRAEVPGAALRRAAAAHRTGARAWPLRPGLLLLDEPLSALDAIVRAHLRQEIREPAAPARRDHPHGHARPGRGAGRWPTASSS
jgi:iron(III) transport system ATP-binding protein